jgi:C-5 cytosine-specific DNA methylase
MPSDPRPRILDLFSGAGGAAMGYARAGFEVVGVDNRAQRHYPFDFRQADAIAYLEAGGWIGFDAIHASPPCQPFTRAGHLMRAQGRTTNKPDLVAPIRERLDNIGLPYVLENVEGAPVQGITLCGSTFGLGVRRHRLFESNVLLFGAECAHSSQGRPVGVYGRQGDTPQGRSTATGRWVVGGQVARTIDQAREAMGVDWMTWGELKESIPPAYTEWIGRQLRAIVR